MKSLLAAGVAFLIAHAAGVSSQEILSVPVNIVFPSPSSKTDADLEYSFSDGRMKLSEMCSKLKSSNSRLNFGCELKTLEEVKAMWKKNDDNSAWASLSCLKGSSKESQALVKSIVEDALGSATVSSLGKLSLKTPEVTGRFIFACSRFPGCLKDHFSAEERQGFAEYLLSQTTTKPEVLLGLQGLSSFGMASVIVQHKRGENTAHVLATSLVGKPLAWTLGPQSSPFVSKQQEQDVVITTADHAQLQVEIKLTDSGVSKLFVLSLPQAARIENVKVEVKGSDKLVLDKNQVLDVSFQLVFGSSAEKFVCPDHATVALISKQRDFQFPLTCDSTSGFLKLALTNTPKLSEQVEFETDFYVALIVSDENTLAQGILHSMPESTVHIVPFDRPARKSLPLFATSLLHESDTTLQALPEIHHQFRIPDRRANALLALVFSVLQVVWLGGLLMLFHSKGFHVLKIFTSVRLLFFALTLVGIEVVFVWYWVGWGGAPNMENLTYKVLPPLLIILIVANKSVLQTSTASSKSKKKVASM